MARLAIAALLLAVVPTLAEERTFSVTAAGHPAGDLVLTFQKRADETTAVTVRTEYRAERPTPFAYEYRGTETWKDGRVVRLEGLGTQDRVKGGITLVAGKGAYALKAGVKEVSVRGEVWPTTGAMIPDPDGKPLVVDVITGDVLRARVDKVGADRITVAGKQVPVTRYRVTAGGNRWDVWYDGAGRLAKRVWTRDGRTVVAELTRLAGD
jgi:YD repeat-containing protein